MVSLQDTLNDLQEKNYFEILGASIDTPANAISRARRKLLSQFHPDRHNDVKDKEIATKISSIINVAYEALTDDRFRDKYISSGYTLRYGEMDDVPVKQKKDITKKLRGRNLYAFLYLKGDDLFKGGTFETVTVDENEPRTVEIPPNVQAGTHLILKGQGEQYSNGENGDLILVIRKESNGNIPPVFTNPQSIIPVVSKDDINRVTFFGSENLTEGEGVLYLKQCDITSEGLIIKY